MIPMDNVTTNEKISNDTDKEEEYLPADKDIEEEHNES